MLMSPIEAVPAVEDMGTSSITAADLPFSIVSAFDSSEVILVIVDVKRTAAGQGCRLQG